MEHKKVQTCEQPYVHKVEVEDEVEVELGEEVRDLREIMDVWYQCENVREYTRDRINEQIVDDLYQCKTVREYARDRIDELREMSACSSGVAGTDFGILESR